MGFGGYLKYTGNIAGELMPRDFHGGPGFARVLIGSAAGGLESIVEVTPDQPRRPVGIALEQCRQHLPMLL